LRFDSYLFLIGLDYAEIAFVVVLLAVTQNIKLKNLKIKTEEEKTLVVYKLCD